MSSASRGSERSAFVDNLLSAILPPPYRFGTGDITDISGSKSGQLDVVVEFPFLPSLPIIGHGSSRLYLAEGVAAVIEVKSDVAAQWDEVLKTANSLAALTRSNFSLMSRGSEKPSTRIPFFAVGYKGWKTIETVKERLSDGPIDGILVIGPPCWFASGSSIYDLRCGGALSLWGLVSCLSYLTLQVGFTSFEPISYTLRFPSPTPPQSPSAASPPHAASSASH